MTRALPLLDQLDAYTAAEVGGKAVNLGRLLRSGFDVPPGFVIPVTVTAALTPSAPSGWPEDIRAAIEAAARTLCPGGEAVAVRSSATDEDGAGASFAGQHDTVLGVEAGGLCEAVARCLASLDSEASRAYRTHAGQTGTAGMAVVVQHMVEGEASGVAFSVDPATGQRDVIVVESVPGRGEALVDGTREADRMRFSRATLACIEHHEAGSPSLDEATARHIATLAVEVEDALGSPQDIEFTVRDGKVWLLQARPITTTMDSSATGWHNEFDTPTDDTTHWTSANVQEVLPGLLSPLAITTFELTCAIAYTSDYHELHLLDRDESPQFVGFFYNRAFLNVSAIRLIAGRALLTSSDAIEDRYLGGARTALPRESFFGRWKYRLISTLPLVRAWIHFDRDVDHMERQILEAERRLSRVDVRNRPDADLEDLRQKAVRFGARMFRIHLRVTAAAGGIFDQTAASVRTVLGDETEGMLPVLFSGMQDVESAELTTGIWDLSRIARAEGLRDAVKDPAFDALDPALPEPWRTALEAFLHRHGHRGLNEMEASARTWRQDPAPFMATVAAYVDLDNAQSPRETLRRQAERRLELTADLAAAMGPVQRRLFLWQLGQSQHLVSLRERTKSLAVRAARFSDFFTPEYTRRLLERDIIDQPDDIHFLTWQEIDALFHGHPDSDYRARIIRRRRDLERNRHIELPEHFAGHPSPIEPDLSAHSGEVLSGTPVSPGQVTGRARVILDPARDSRIEPGEILVAPVTDAGWTPLFAVASGLIVDMGSTLSHGSTVAREYGLPAVVNVRHATRRIHTGDLLLVDGSKGTVAILEPAST